MHPGLLPVHVTPLCISASLSLCLALNKDRKSGLGLGRSKNVHTGSMSIQTPAWTSTPILTSRHRRTWLNRLSWVEHNETESPWLVSSDSSPLGGSNAPCMLVCQLPINNKYRDEALPQPGGQLRWKQQMTATFIWAESRKCRNNRVHIFYVCGTIQNLSKSVNACLGSMSINVDLLPHLNCRPTALSLSPYLSYMC